MRIPAVLALVAFLAGGCASTEGVHGTHAPSLGPAYAPKVHWHTLAEGRQIAAGNRRPLIVDFAVPEHCSRCRFLQDNVYSRDSIVAKINADFVPVWIDLTGELTTEERELVMRLFAKELDAVMDDYVTKELDWEQSIRDEGVVIHAVGPEFFGDVVIEWEAIWSKKAPTLSTLKDEVRTRP